MLPADHEAQPALHDAIRSASEDLGAGKINKANATLGKALDAVEAQVVPPPVLEDRVAFAPKAKSLLAALLARVPFDQTEPITAFFDKPTEERRQHALAAWATGRSAVQLAQAQKRIDGQDVAIEIAKLIEAMVGSTAIEAAAIGELAKQIDGRLKAPLAPVKGPTYAGWDEQDGEAKSKGPALERALEIARGMSGKIRPREVLAKTRDDIEEQLLALTAVRAGADLDPAKQQAGLEQAIELGALLGKLCVDRNDVFAAALKGAVADARQALKTPTETPWLRDVALAELGAIFSSGYSSFARTAEYRRALVYHAKNDLLPGLDAVAKAAAGKDVPAGAASLGKVLGEMILVAKLLPEGDPNRAAIEVSLEQARVHLAQGDLAGAQAVVLGVRTTMEQLV
jgi:hypothetical protein